MRTYPREGKGQEAAGSWEVEIKISLWHEILQAQGEFKKIKEAREEAKKGRDKEMQLSQANRMADKPQKLLKTLQHHVQNLSVQMDDIIRAHRI